MIKTFEQFNTVNEGLGMKLYTVTECGKDGNDFFSQQIGVYSTLELAQARMNNCFETTMSAIKENGNDIASFEQDAMETTILFQGGKHMVVIDERNIDEDAEDFYFITK